MFLSCRLMMGAAASAMLAASAACGQSAQIYTFKLPSQPLKDALKEVTKEGGVDLFATSDDLAGRTAPALYGTFTVQTALDTLLSGSGLTADVRDRRVFIRRISAATDIPGLTEITVTGSRIRGAPVASPVTVITQTQMVEAGQTNVGEAVRDLPQNFSGGQNPGVIGGGAQGIPNQNLNSSSTINLRGLGADATLTLLNGHRLAYGSNVQGVDVDSIPLAALDRIEIVTDGASAVYGSDAVAGVANVILKRDYSGLLASARFGAATDGGDAEQQYSVTGGSRWGSGGFMVSADLRRSTAITAGERSYTTNLDPSATLFPWIHQVSGVLTAHQDLKSRVHFSIDSLFSKRTSATQLPSTETESYLEDGSRTHMRDRSLSIAPKISVDIGHSWTGALLGTWGKDDTLGSSLDYSAGLRSDPLHYTYNNTVRVAEISAEGPVFKLPSGAVRLALGGGYRSNRFEVESTLLQASAPPSLSRQTSHRNSYFAYAEVSAPVVSASQSVPWIRTVSLSGAVRYENYPGMASLATPKFGLLYAPSSDLDFKASWGRSFKTPTLYQQHQAQFASLLPAFVLGATGAPAGSTALIRTGGNPDLKPERASGWTVSIDLHPQAIRHLTVNATYFQIRYRNRIAMPLASISGSLGNPLYAPFITNNPDPALLDAIIGSSTGLFNFSGAPYSAANVVSVVDDRVQNVARQSIHGVDLSADYAFDIGSAGQLHTNAALSYLHSDELLIAGQPSTPLAGTIFNAPHWHVRGGAQWIRHALTLSAFVTYIGGVRDNRTSPAAHVRGMAPVDLTATTRFSSAVRWLNGVEAVLAIRNIQNVKPATIQSLTPAEPSYDSANYSAIGRTVCLTLSRAF